MKRITAGEFGIDLFLDGWPIWATLYIDGKEVGRVYGKDLDDLQHVAAKAIRVVQEKEREDRERRART